MKYIVRLEGGIGNQMFQYAHARALQKLYPGKIIFDLHAYNEKQIRHLSLHHLNIAHCEDTSTLSSSENLFFKFLLFSHKIFKTLNIKYSRLFNQESYRLLARIGLYMQFRYKSFDSLLKPVMNMNYISGTYLAPVFFRGVEAEMKRELKVVSNLSEESQTMLEKIMNCNAVCVHIRLGDYLDEKWKDKLYLCTETYYKEAIALMSKKVENPTFFVFSNRHKDIEYIKSQYHFPCDFVYVDLSNPDYADLKLMYRCKHFIMSNSTYSWWAQWLCDNEEKVVIAPSRFSNVRAWDMTDFYSDQWLLVKV